MKVVEDIKEILSNHYDEMEIYDLIGELDTEDDMEFVTSAGEMNVTFTHEGYDIEINLTTEYNVNTGVITVTKDEDLKEVIPFKYEV